MPNCFRTRLAPPSQPATKSMSPGREFVFAMHDVARLFRTLGDQRARAVNMTRAQWSVLKRLEIPFRTVLLCR